MSTKSPEYDHEAFPKDKDRLLGKGRSGVVKKVKRISDGKVLACKKIYLIGDKRLEAFARREREIHGLLDHPNILRVVDVVWGQDALRLYSEFCAQGTLQDVIYQKTRDGELLSETYIWAVLFQLTAALFYCHTGSLVDVKGNFTLPMEEWNPIFHRDIKPANVMLNGNPEKDPSAVKLGDFGLGLIVDNDAAYSTYVGTVSYMAPEISRMQAQSIYWTEHCDIYSLGCTVYHLCALRAPFEYRMESETDNIPRIPHSFSDTLQKCVESCLAFKPIRRKGLLFLLQHAKSRVSFASDNSLIQVEQDIAPEGSDQHSRRVPHQPSTGDALALSYTPFEATAPERDPPRTGLPTPLKARKNGRAKPSQVLPSSQYRRGSSSVTLPERSTSGTTASVWHTLQFGTFTADVEGQETPPVSEPLGPSNSNVSSDSQASTSEVADRTTLAALLGPLNIAPPDRELFAALSRTHPTKWVGSTMVVSDTFQIDQPYTAVDVNLVEGRDGDLSQMQEKVDLERRKIALKFSKDLIDSPSPSPVPLLEVPRNTKPSTIFPPNAKPTDNDMTDVNVEVKVLKQFREFADAEQQRLIERRKRQQTEDRANKLKELLRFSKTFKLKTPVPDDLIGILARDPGRQEDIIEKAQQQHEHSNSGGAAETSSATVADSTDLAQAPPPSKGDGRRKRNKKNKKRGAAPQPVRTNYTNSVLDFARDD